MQFFSITVLILRWRPSFVCFSTPIETPPKHGFWTLQQYLLMTKIVAFFSWCARIKRSHWMLSQGCTADDKTIRRFGHSIRRWFEPMCECSHCHDEEWFVFSCLFFYSDWDTSKTWVLNPSTASYGDEDRWLCIFLLICINKKKSLQSQGCTADDPPIRYFGRLKRR